MAGDFEPQDDNCCLPPPLQRAPTLGDPADRKPDHRSGYGNVDLDAVLERARKWDGHGIRPNEVMALVAFIEDAKRFGYPPREDR